MFERSLRSLITYRHCDGGCRYCVCVFECHGSSFKTLTEWAQTLKYYLAPIASTFHRRSLACYLNGHRYPSSTAVLKSQFRLWNRRSQSRCDSSTTQTLLHYQKSVESDLCCDRMPSELIFAKSINILFMYICSTYFVYTYVYIALYMTVYYRLSWYPAKYLAMTALELPYIENLSLNIFLLCLYWIFYMFL